MDRRQLKSILTKYKNALKKGAKWEELDIRGVYDNCGECYIIYEEYEGTINKKELENLDRSSKLDWYKCNDDNIVIQYDRYDNRVYGEVYVTYCDKSGFYNRQYLEICNTPIL